MVWNDIWRLPLPLLAHKIRYHNCDRSNKETKKEVYCNKKWLSLELRNIM